MFPVDFFKKTLSFELVKILIGQTLKYIFFIMVAGVLLSATTLYAATFLQESQSALVSSLSTVLSNSFESFRISIENSIQNALIPLENLSDFSKTLVQLLKENNKKLTELLVLQQIMTFDPKITLVLNQRDLILLIQHLIEEGKSADEIFEHLKELKTIAQATGNVSPSTSTPKRPAIFSFVKKFIAFIIHSLASRP